MKPALMILAILIPLLPAARAADQLQILQYHQPGLVVDLGVGLWSWPVVMDADGDGDYDLIVSCQDKPFNGVWLFENAAGDTAKYKFPIFKAPRKLSRGVKDLTPSYVDGKVIVAVTNQVFPDFAKTGVDNPVKLKLPASVHPNKLRFNQWRYVDFDGDGKLDLTIGIEDWTAYGWDNAYDSAGNWKNGPLNGQIYLLKNTGSTAKPKYADPLKLTADGKIIDGFGCPSQCFEDFDGDGDLDLITGEFLDGFTYYQNTGTRQKPSYVAGIRLPFTMDLEMIVVMAIDWDKDGDADLIVGQEDGRIALIENTGEKQKGLPQFLPPRFFQQEAGDVKFGVLTTPVGVDWDGDGDTDLVSGNSAGYLGFIENLGESPGNLPRWAAPRELTADGQVIRIMAGPNGSIQGPAEAKWGYTTLSVNDWDGDGLKDLIVNSIWGKIIWHRNTGTAKHPKLTAAQPIEVEWPGAAPKPAWVWWEPKGKELVTQWRTTPVTVDWNKDGLMDLVMLDQEGYLSFFERAKKDGKQMLLPPRRIFVDEEGKELMLAAGVAGKSGRRKFCITDWDGDGKLDILLNSQNAEFLRNISQSDDKVVFKKSGNVDTLVLTGHDTSPTPVDFGGVKGLLIGAEDGRFYYMKKPGN